jgi:uncharacterized membrane protein
MLARKLKPVEVADYIALLICLSAFVSLLPGLGEVIPYASIPFYLIIPGYAFVRSFLDHMPSDEKAVALVVFSIAMSTFVKVITEVFLEGYSMSGVVVLDILSLAMLGSAIARERRAGLVRA